MPAGSAPVDLSYYIQQNEMLGNELNLVYKFLNEKGLGDEFEAKIQQEILRKEIIKGM